MGITYGDHLIDSGYYDITPEQEREIEEHEDAQTIRALRAALTECVAYIESPLRMTSDEDEAARRSRIASAARAALNAA
jgi:hypothetical protein